MFFRKLLEKYNLNSHDDRPLWKYHLSNDDYLKLKEHLKNGGFYGIDSRDACLYYSLWWSKGYNGGKPSKKMVYDSVGWSDNYVFNHEDFYRLAVKGANRLGLTWIRKTYMLYFKTLLLQGGLPLKHIEANYGAYLSFLLAVIEIEPNSIDDFAFDENITRILPKSSQNETIYENCFEIVDSILNDKGEYNELLASNDTTKTISKELREKLASIERKKRDIKPKIQRILVNHGDEYNIELRVSLADFFDSDSLANVLGIEPTQNEYQLFVEDNLLCVFRKTLGGEKFKTDWHHSGKFLLENLDSGLPNTYVVVNDEKHRVLDFVQKLPSFETPTLWSKFSENEWRFVKSNGSTNNEAAVLLPKKWECSEKASFINIYDNELKFCIFEGEIEVGYQTFKKCFYSGVSSFDWTILSTPPEWMVKANMPVVKKAPEVLIYDDSGERVKESGISKFIKKRNSSDDWERLSSGSRLDEGCFELKIDYDNIVAYDQFYCIGNFNLDQFVYSIERASFRVELSTLDFQIRKNNELNIKQSGIEFSVEKDKSSNKIPQAIWASLKKKNEKSLQFQFESPLTGIAIVDNNGEVVSNNRSLQINNIGGLRVIGGANKELNLCLYNSHKEDIKRYKRLKGSYQPLISFKDDILGLLYLGDVMDHENLVFIELLLGSQKIRYEIRLFSKTLLVDHQKNNKVQVDKVVTEEFDLAAIPLNVHSDSIEVMPLDAKDNEYSLPMQDATSDYIVISINDAVGQLMPRFTTFSPEPNKISKEERIEQYHVELLENDFGHESWKVLHKYFQICQNNDIPFITLDQIRSIAGSSKVAAKAFLFLGHKAGVKKDFYIQKTVPRLEQELGICFHWISQKDWNESIQELHSYIISRDWFNELVELKISSEDKVIEDLVGFVNYYCQNSGLEFLPEYIFTGRIQQTTNIYRSDIQVMRSQLGQRVLSELPKYGPKVNEYYGVAYDGNESVKALIKSPIAVGESISGIDVNYSIWSLAAGVGKIRRIIQYAQDLTPHFYRTLLKYTLERI